jgi:ABC-type multidrug transport system fused ATPase/permease subunit
LTKESLWVSGRIGGTFHSKVSLVSKGFSHISTTLDPGWYGPLLITIRNNTDKEMPIPVGATFVTLIFSTVKTPTKSRHFKPEFRKDILLAQMENQTQNYIKKIATVLNNTSALAEFESRVILANESMPIKVLASARKIGWLYMLNSTFLLIISFAVISLIFLSNYWDKVRHLFGNIDYDSKIFAVQITAIIALISLFLNFKRKN